MSDGFVNLPIAPPPFPKTRQEYLDKFEKNSGFLMRLYEGWRWDREKLGWLQAWQERDAVKGTCTRFMALVRGDGKVLPSTISSWPLDCDQLPPERFSARIDEKGYLRGVSLDYYEWK